MDSSTSILFKFANECLERHNYYRRKHGVPPLKYSKSMCNYAQEWAEVVAEEDSMRHRPNGKYGENIYAKWSSNPAYRIKANEAVDSWYAEIKYYDFNADGFSTSRTGHFTQVVWKGSREFGAGAARSESGKIYVVGNYDPPGNIRGAFETNVLPPKDFYASR